MVDRIDSPRQYGETFQTLKRLRMGKIEEVMSFFLTLQPEGRVSNLSREELCLYLEQFDEDVLDSPLAEYLYLFLTLDNSTDAYLDYYLYAFGDMEVTQEKRDAINKQLVNDLRADFMANHLSALRACCLEKVLNRELTVAEVHERFRELLLREAVVYAAEYRFALPAAWTNEVINFEYVAEGRDQAAIKRDITDDDDVLAHAGSNVVSLVRGRIASQEESVRERQQMGDDLFADSRNDKMAFFKAHPDPDVYIDKLIDEKVLRLVEPA